MMNFLLDPNLVLAHFVPPPRSRLQVELAFLAGQEIERAIDLVVTASETAPPDQPVDCFRTAVAASSAPDGGVYSVTVIVQRKPPHA